MNIKNKKCDNRRINSKLCKTRLWFIKPGWPTDWKHIWTWRRTTQEVGERAVCPQSFNTRQWNSQIGLDFIKFVITTTDPFIRQFAMWVLYPGQSTRWVQLYHSLEHCTYSTHWVPLYQEYSLTTIVPRVLIDYYCTQSIHWVHCTQRTQWVPLYSEYTLSTTVPTVEIEYHYSEYP